MGRKKNVHQQFFETDVKCTNSTSRNKNILDQIQANIFLGSALFFFLLTEIMGHRNDPLTERIIWSDFYSNI